MTKVMIAYNDGGETKYKVVEPQQQAVDLDDTYMDEEEDKKAHDIIDGLECYSNGKLSDYHLQLVGLQPVNPIATNHPNHLTAVLGGEGFISNIIDGIIKFVKWVIDIIRKAIYWIIDKVKVMLGLKKSDELLKETMSKRDDIVNQLNQIIINLGLNPAQYDFKSLIEEMPEDANLPEAAKFVKNKFDDNAQHIERLAGVVPKLNKLYMEVEKINRKVIDGKNKMDHRISAIKNKFQSNQLTTLDMIELIKGYESYIYDDINYDDLVKVFSELLNELTTVKFDFPVLKNNLALKMRQLDETRITVTKSMNRQERGQLYLSIKANEQQLMNASGKTIDVSHLDPKALADLVKIGHAEFIQTLATSFKKPEIAMVYQKAVNEGKNYVLFLDQCLKTIAGLNAEISNMCKWMFKVEAFLSTIIVRDAATAVKLRNEWMANGETDPLKNTQKLIFIKNYTPKYIRASQEISQNLLERNVGNLTTAINNFARQLNVKVRVG